MARLTDDQAAEVEPRNTCRGEAGTDAMLTLLAQACGTVDALVREATLTQQVLRALLEKARGRG